MKNNIFLIGLITLCLSFGSYALSPDKFTSLEYHVNTGVGKTLPYAANKQTDKFNQAFDFIEFNDEVSVQWVTYIDTPKRSLNAESIYIRVRENVTNPRKSKITVKLRAANPEGFGDLSSYKKAEIDYTGDKAAYSVSYDIPYSPADIDVKNVDIDAVFKILKSNSTIWKIVGSLYEQNKADLTQTIVMRSHGWEGYLKEPRFDNIGIEFQLWTPYYRKPRVTFSEFSFRGHVNDKQQLEAVNDFLYQKVNAVGFPSGHTGSKTTATFDMTAKFN
ncbi:MAG: hypothetical protein V5789_14815 [Colwellia sp.]